MNDTVLTFILILALLLWIAFWSLFVRHVLQGEEASE